MKLLSKNLSLLLYPSIIFICWRLLIFLFQIFVQPYYKITNDSITLYQRLFQSWITYWDNGHYLSIAINGYQYPQQAFFPLWPLLIKIFSSSGIPIGIIMYILSALFGYLTFILFFLLAKGLIGASKAKLSLLLFALFPSTMFIHAAYTEGLFLTLTLLSFLFLERKYYFMATLIAGISLATRIVGIALVVAFSKKFYSSYKRIGIYRILFYAVLGISGLLSYIIFLQINYGDPLYFIKAQNDWCASQGRCDFKFPLTSLIQYANLILIGWVKPNLSSTFIDWLAASSFLILLIPVLKRLGFSYFIYSLIVLILPLFSSTVGMIRYVLVAFPVFFIFPTIIRSRLIFYLICLILFLLQLRFVAIFTSRIWVA